MKYLVIRLRSLFSSYTLVQLAKWRAIILASQQVFFEKMDEKEHELHARYLYLHEKANRIQDSFQRQELTPRELMQSFDGASADLVKVERLLDGVGEKLSLHHYMKKYA